MRRALTLIGTLAAAFVLMLPPASGADQPPFEINAIVSQTGAAAFIGQSVSRTLGTVESVVNASGGIRGRQLKFVLADDGSNPQNAVALASRLIATKVPVIVGPGFVATCSATMPLAAANGPVMWCTSPGIYPPAGGYVFAAGATTDDTTLIMTRYARERHWTKLAVIASTDASGQAWDHGVQYALARLENKDVQVTIHEHMNPTDISVAAQLARIKTAAPQALLTLATGTPWGTIMRGVADAGIDVPIIGGNGNVSYAQLKQYESFLPKEVFFPANLSLVPDVVGPGPTKNVQSVYFAAFKRQGIVPDLGYNTAWDPAMIIVSGLRALGPNATAEQLRDYIVKLHGFIGTNGSCDFRDGAQRGIGPGAMAMFRYEKGKGEFSPVSAPAGYPK
jgi:branched-chain amino acid transport system substrate-binding protein